MILSDIEIRKLIVENRMIEPAVTELVGRDQGKMSYGPSSYGYDLRLGNQFAVYRPSDEPLDPLDVRPDDLEWIWQDEKFVLPPRGFALATTVETVTMPPDVTGLVHDKSSYARVSINAQNTVLEAGWTGQVTLEIVNNIDRPVILHVGHGVVQVLFLRGNPCEVSYADRGGSYQGQKGVTLPTRAYAPRIGRGRDDRA